MFHVISDIVLTLFTCLGCRILGNVWNARCYGQFYTADDPYTYSSMTGKMAGTSVITDFLAHWHTSLVNFPKADCGIFWILASTHIYQPKSTEKLNKEILLNLGLF